jgi:chromosome partitioning protein
MSKTKIVYIGGSKGGVGKSLDSHLTCLGAILRNQLAAYVLTDPDRSIRGEGRPYSVLDGRRPDQLASILNASRRTLNGWLIINGGGNRPSFDSAIAAEADLCILPFRPSEEDLDTVGKDMALIPKSIAWPTAWPTNMFANRAARFYIEGLEKAFPSRVITRPIPFVNSASELLSAKLDSPSSPVRSLARMVFGVMEETYDLRAARLSKRAAGR